MKGQLVETCDLGGFISQAEPPAVLLAALGGLGVRPDRLVPVWKNAAGGLTFSVLTETGSKNPEFYAKWNRKSTGESLVEEADRMRWLHRYHPTPRVVSLVDTESEEALITEALPGKSAVSNEWSDRPNVTLKALGEGLRHLHDLDPSDCPFTWDAEDRRSACRSDVGPPPPVDRLVVCSGDPCAPNTLIADNGQFLAHVDVGRLGVADRWADLAVMVLSLGWNFDGFDQGVFWGAYGVEPDRERIAYYQNLWNQENAPVRTPAPLR